MHSTHTILSALQAVGPKAGSAAAAQAQDATPAAPAGAQGHDQAAPSFGIAYLVPLLILVPFFFIQSRRQKKEQQERAKLKRGDKVLATSGLVGELVDLDDRFAKVKLAPGITVQMLASTLGPLDVVDPATAPKTSDKDALKDLKEAKVAADKSAPAKS